MPFKIFLLLHSVSSPLKNRLESKIKPNEQPLVSQVSQGKLFEIAAVLAFDLSSLCWCSHRTMTTSNDGVRWAKPCLELRRYFSRCRVWKWASSCHQESRWLKARSWRPNRPKNEETAMFSAMKHCCLSGWDDPWNVLLMIHFENGKMGSFCLSNATVLGQNILFGWIKFISILMVI